MQHVNLGKTGLKVSRLCLGCMTYGTPAWRPWVLSEDDSRPFIRRAIELGITFFDTADMYSTRRERGGRSVARSATSRRATRSSSRPRRSSRWDAGPNDRGLSRKHLLDGDRRLAPPARHRLRRPLPDPPLGPRDADRRDAGGAQRHREGRQGALHRRVEHVRLAVRAGALPAPTGTAGRRFVSMQNHYNLVYREEEREMLPLCLDEGVGRHSRGARSRAASSRATARREDWGDTARAKTDDYAHRRSTTATPTSTVARRVSEVARERGVKPHAGGARVDAGAAGRHRSDHRRDAARAPRRRGGRAGPHADGRGTAAARGAVRAAPRARPPLRHEWVRRTSSA